MFRITANSPVPWKSVAYELVAAGNLCFRRYARLHPLGAPPSFVSYHEDVSPRSFLMLYAFALEDLLKAVWLAQGNRAVVANALDKDFKKLRHDLQAWWTRASIRAASSDETIVLDFLTSSVEIGRYPVHSSMRQRDGRLVEPHAARAVILRMLDEASLRLNDLMPGVSIKPPSLKSLGLRRVPIRWKVPTKTRRARP